MSADARSVAQAVAEATWVRSYVAAPAAGWVTVAPDLGCDVVELAKALSLSQATVAIGVDLYDGDVCWVGAFRLGKRLFRATQAELYSEYADVTTTEPGVTILRGKGKDADRTRLVGRFENLARHVAATAAEISQALHPARVAPEDIPTALGAVLGVPRDRAWFSFPGKRKPSIRSAKLVKGMAPAPEPKPIDHESDDWTPEVACLVEPPAAIIHPRRDRPCPYSFPDAPTSWSRVRALRAWKKSPRYELAEPLRESGAQAIAALEAVDVPPPGTREVDALVLWLGGRTHKVTDSYFPTERMEIMTLSYEQSAQGEVQRIVEPTAFDGIVDGWVATYGALEALLRVIASMGIEPTFPIEGRPGVLARAAEPWVTIQKAPLYRLRRHLSLVSDTEFERAREGVRSAFTSWSPLQQLAAAYAIATDAELANRAGHAVLAARCTQGAAPILARGCITEPTLVASLCTLPSNTQAAWMKPGARCNARWELGADHPRDDELGIMTLVAAVGEAALPVVERFRSQIHRTKTEDPQRPWMFASRG